MIMRLQKRRAEKGFTLIELLIVIAIIGIIAALLIPNFLESLQKAKQKRSMGDMRNVGTAWFSWLTDQYGAAAAAGQDITTPSGDWSGQIRSDLVPQYIQRIPSVDSWGKTLTFCRVADTDLLSATSVMSIGSPGNDGTASQSSCGQTFAPTTYDPTDYAQDIVWLDGFFVYYPNRTDLPAS